MTITHIQNYKLCFHLGLLIGFIIPMWVYFFYDVTNYTVSIVFTIFIIFVILSSVYYKPIKRKKRSND